MRGMKAQTTFSTCVTACLLAVGRAANAQEPQPAPPASAQAAASGTPAASAAQPSAAASPQGGLFGVSSGGSAEVPVNARDFLPFVLQLPREHLFGDWLGLRTRLEDDGVTPTLTFVSDILGNPVGGRRRGFTDADNLGLDLAFDLEKLYGLKGGRFEFSMSQRSGANLSAIDVGNVFTTQQVYGGETLKIIDVAYRQKLLDDRVEFRVGRIAAGDDFLVSPYDYLFVQNAFDGNPVGIFFNAPGMTAYPNATWGVLAKVKPTERTYVMGGLYNGDPSIRDIDHHGLDWSLNGPLFAIGEVGYQRNGRPGDTGLLGNYRAGAWYDGSRYNDFTSVGFGLPPRVTHGNWGFYGLADQVLVRFGEPGSNRGLGVVGSVMASPQESVSQLPFFCTAAVAIRGIVPSRPIDVGGFGVVYGHFSNDLQDGQRRVQQSDPTVGVQTHETVLEWTYRFAMRQGAVYLQPDLQYILRPGGTGRIPDALVVGAQVGFNF
jgi:porin